jgi:hypothetical protein
MKGLAKCGPVVGRVHPVGTRVRYTRAWLQKTGSGPTADVWHRRGVVAAQEGPWCVVDWGDFSSRVHPVNVAPIGSSEDLTIDAPGWAAPAYGTNSTDPFSLEMQILDRECERGIGRSVTVWMGWLTHSDLDRWADDGGASGDAEFLAGSVVLSRGRSSAS